MLVEQHEAGSGMDLNGVQLPTRARVESSAADSGGYRATVVVLDGRGESTGQVIEDVPLDRQWLGRDGAGWFAPPMPGRIVWVDWADGSVGHPAIVASAERDAPVPFVAVPQGAAAWEDGAGTEIRFHADGRILIRHRTGAEVSTDLTGLWKMASAAEDLKAVLDAWLDALIAANTTAPATFAPATIAALTAIKTRLANLLRP